MFNLGMDPEWFIADSSNEYYDAGMVKNAPFACSPVTLHDNYGLPYLGGSPEHPVLFSSEEDNIKLVMDGVAIEGNTYSPFNNAKSMYKAVNDLLSAGEELSETYGRNLINSPVVNFDYKKYWDAERIDKDVTFQYGMIFGCDKDYSAVDRKFSSPTLDASKHPLRYGGGHIHFSSESLNLRKLVIPTIRLCDCLIGTWSIISATPEQNELNKVRSKTYGKASRYRPQEYGGVDFGIEYRSCSNVWTSFPLEKFEELFYLYGIIENTLKNNLDTGLEAIEKYGNSAITGIETINVSKCTEVFTQTLSMLK